jgi:hypothetical protein
VRVQNAQDAGRGRGSEALGLREKVCFRVLFESLQGRGTVDVGGELVPQSGTIIGTMAYQGTPQKCVCVCVCEGVGTPLGTNRALSPVRPGPLG